MEPAGETTASESKPPVKRRQGKHYSEYLVQGLMIFVSVSLGFLSQNMRERISSREKEAHYISSYLRNLQVDSVELAVAIGKNEYKLKVLDSIMELSDRGFSEPAGRMQFYRNCFSIVSFYAIFRSNDATYLQLTNSDGLRSIRRDNVADSISQYAFLVKEIYAAEDIYDGATAAALNLAHEVLDYSILYDSSYYRDHQLTGKYIPLITDDPRKIKLFLNKVYFERAATKNYLEHLRAFQPFLQRFIIYLQMQYPTRS